MPDQIKTQPEPWLDRFADAPNSQTISSAGTAPEPEQIKVVAAGDDLFGASLEWHKGPAEGGVGTAETNDEGLTQWYNGDRLLIIIETNRGREIAVVDIDADEECFLVTDASSGDTYDAWAPEDWSWWAKLTKHNLPPNDRSQPHAEDNA